MKFKFPPAPERKPYAEDDNLTEAVAACLSDDPLTEISPVSVAIVAGVLSIGSKSSAFGKVSEAIELIRRCEEVLQDISIARKESSLINLLEIQQLEDQSVRSSSNKLVKVSEVLKTPPSQAIVKRIGYRLKEKYPKQYERWDVSGFATRGPKGEEKSVRTLLGFRSPSAFKDMFVRLFPKKSLNSAPSSGSASSEQERYRSPEENVRQSRIEEWDLCEMLNVRIQEMSRKTEAARSAKVKRQQRRRLVSK